MTLTKELLQERIDHYNALCQGEHIAGRARMSSFYMGKADAYINLINELYPELEGKRVFPRDVKRLTETINFVTSLK